jgi:hypothetical protein
VSISVEAVARAIDPLAWTDYGDRKQRQWTLDRAKEVIPVVTEALAQEADSASLAHVVNPLIPPISDWLRSQKPGETR